MRIWVITIDSVIFDKSFTALKDACEAAGIGYMSAVKGKRVFTKDDQCIRITQAEVVRSKQGNRTGNAFKNMP